MGAANVSGVDFELTIGGIDKGRGTAGGGTLTFDNTNGIAELTGVPVLPSGLTSSSTTFNVDVPVDSETAEIDLMLGYDSGGTFNLVATGTYAPSSLAAQTATVPMTVFAALPSGSYYLWVFTCNAADCASAGTWYINSTSAPGTYLQISFTSGTVLGTPVETGVTIPTVTIP